MTNPTLITTPFAENGDKNTIPESVGANPQNATMQAGFPPITQQKISEGGIPPERNDFNGILNLYGQHIVHLNKGLPYEFDQAFADAIGGYPLNARIMLDNGDIVRSTIANNTTNPNSDMTGWVKVNSASQIVGSDGNPIDIKPIPSFDSSLSYVEGSVVLKDGMLQKYTNGTWQPKSPSYYDFGAKIDGVTDDTAAFIAYHKVFKYARLPKGRMLLSSIDLDQFKSNQTVGLNITGDGTEQSFFDFTGNLGFYSSSNTFFRDFRLSGLQLNRKAGDTVGIGLYIGSAGAEQVHIDSVTYRGWLIGRATHTWNSSMSREVFRLCKYPFSHYGTSTPIVAPYALSCSSPYMLGYQSSSTGVLSIPSIPSAYSMLDSFAADDCGADGSIYKFGRVSGVTGISMSCERPKGAYIFDFSDMVATRFSNVVFDNFTIDITSTDTTVTSLIKKPTTPFGNVIFNNLKASTSRAIKFVSGDGSGVQLVNPQMNDLGFSGLCEEPAGGIRVNNISYGKDTRQSGEIGLTIGSDSYFYRLKNRKGKALINPNTQKLVFYAGLLSEGLGQGLMISATIGATPLTKGGTGTPEKIGIIKFGCAMDFNATDMTRQLNTLLLGTLTTATTVTRNTANTTQLQFDVVIESSSSNTRYMLDIDVDYNGISNTNGICWDIVSK